MPNTVGYDKSYVSINARHDVAEARSLLDMYGYVDRDGDGWRELPDGSPLVLQWATTPDQRARQRDELRRKDMNSIGIRVQFTPAKWPENLKNARAGKLMVWNLGSALRHPTVGRRSMPGLPLTRAARIWHASTTSGSTRFISVFECCPMGRSASSCFSKASDC